VFRPAEHAHDKAVIDGVPSRSSAVFKSGDGRRVRRGKSTCAGGMSAVIERIGRNQFEGRDLRPWVQRIARLPPAKRRIICQDTMRPRVRNPEGMTVRPDPDERWRCMIWVAASHPVSSAAGIAAAGRT